jgi:ParB family chromosome partitioning protein
MQKARKGLGRGLSALIPDADMDFLTHVARGDITSISDGVSSGSTRSKRESAPSEKQTIQNSKPDKSNTPKVNDALGRTSHKQATLPAKEELRSLAELVPLSQIEANPYQPRRTFSDEEMQELSDSVRQHGVLQPVLLRPLPGSDAKTPRPSGVVQYQLIAGERRWRASQNAGLTEIPAIIRRVTDQQALELAVIENVQRHDISALDAAIAYRRLGQEFSLSQEEIARRVGKSRASVSNTIRLLDLPAEVQKAITEGDLTEGHGRAILLSGSDGARRAVFRRVLREKLSVRATEELARVVQREMDNEGMVDTKGNSDQDSQRKTHPLPEIRRIEEGLQKHLGTRVRLRPRKRGGQIVIQYFSNEELERLLKTIFRT